MTRTERAAYPRALNRDRSESRTGLDPNLRKRGAGNHNWGSLADEQRLEAGALDDENMELAEEVEGKVGVEPAERSRSGSSATSNSLTEEERERARQLRKNAFKKGDQLDLAAIARSSAAVSGSPPTADNISRRPGQVTVECEKL
ncbi:hypothetical protein P691DRAFT_792830 [Macrolepiota fuliginosa MF-IS2]|uniref:Hyaluronan/mRNA-binding protein domain-containing protein n=1 Tax=Macrolepiota fuliginosa MF-IS2 TaxID=1400762 RepID=A0A9P5XM48_9AGAR|nr:hypothetical protein P691DRAFT_792830 [Macrolepiota fuliginosa MF-IS2]